MKCYLVTDGCYSSYHVVAAFTTKEKAEEYRDNYNDTYSYSDAIVEEVELDPEIEPKNMKERIWYCEFCDDTFSSTSDNEIIAQELDLEGKEIVYCMNAGETDFSCPDITIISVRTNRRSIAMRIAQERFTAIKAMRETHYPLLDKSFDSKCSWASGCSYVYEWGTFKTYNPSEIRPNIFYKEEEEEKEPYIYTDEEIAQLREEARKFEEALNDLKS